MHQHPAVISVDLAQKTDTDHAQDTPPRVSSFFPAARGVVEFIAHDASTILLASAGNIRLFIAARLNEDNQSSAKANLAPITKTINAYPTGSGFESDWIVHERARKADPALYTKLNEQNQRALLVLDPKAGTWRVANTLAPEIQPHEHIIAPILTSKAARALGEALDDVFELCRFPKELAQAPLGSPCAYKQMGRCPGACDGSESMDAYKKRFQQALGAAAGGVEQWKHQVKNEIALASSTLAFEHAQLAKRQLEQVEKLPLDALGLAKLMHEMRCVCISPSVRKGWAMVWGFGSDGLVPIMSVNEDAAPVDLLIDMWHGEDAYESIEFNQLWLDRFALTARHWMTKPSRARRRRVTILDLRDQPWGPDFRAQLKRAIADACIPADSGHQDEEHTHIKGSTRLKCEPEG